LEKIDYSIGYVSKYLRLPQSVLRYWETVFDVLNPEKSPGGTRKYNEQDIEIVKQIKHLLYDEKFTIAGANKYLNSSQSSEKIEKDAEYIKIPRNHFLQLIYELEVIINTLKSK